MEALVISVPAAELPMAFSGGIVDAQQLLQVKLPRDLADAVRLVLQARGDDAPLRCILRPEMYTNDRSLLWLQRRIGRVENHLALSDGMAVRLLAGASNHLFPYGLHTRQRRSAFLGMMRQAPEIGPQLGSVVNAGPGLETPVRPTRILMPKDRLGASGLLWYYPFYLNPYSHEDSAGRMLSWAALSPPDRPSEATTFVPMTEISCQSPAFLGLLAQRIAETLFRPGERLIMALPAGGTEALQRLQLLLSGLIQTRVRIPRARAHNVFVVSAPLPEEQLEKVREPLTWILHPEFPFWQYTPALYAGARELRLVVDAIEPAGAAAWTELFSSACGQPVSLMRADRDGHWPAASGHP